MNVLLTLALPAVFVAGASIYLMFDKWHGARHPSEQKALDEHPRFDDSIGFGGCEGGGGGCGGGGG